MPHPSHIILLTIWPVITDIKGVNNTLVWIKKDARADSVESRPMFAKDV
eukprot:CAMPEP_0172429154 /NCGR_PEP_ID=MMETSP1064-20121228/49345_1 /TAXON_ID=202472 /ORGANISM="Aulacoseira subarctica , Strain CCAP 1002/5" /LENGTH=48 /DNA_ID= /DNA_START= /DNA_END= /DNA_ORIENTATION=